MGDVAIHLFSGTIAGMSSVIVDYPLDTLKVKVQSGCHFDTHFKVPNADKSPLRSPLLRFTNNTEHVMTRCSIFRRPLSFLKQRISFTSNYTACIVQSYRNGGVRSFYRGASIPLLAQGVENAVIFSVYRGVLDRLESSKRINPVSPWCSPATLFASACAGAAVSVILTPVEFVKCNLQVSSTTVKTRRDTSVRRFIHKTWKKNGVSGFFVGHCGTMIRAVPGNVAYFVSYEQMKAWFGLSTPNCSSKMNTWEYQWKSMLAGGISGCSYWTICFPADVVKTRMQVQPTYAQLNFRQAFISHYKETGISGMYRGWGVTAVRSFITSAIVFSVFERLSSVYVSNKGMKEA